MPQTLITHRCASPGIAIGRAHLLATNQSEIPHYWIIDREIESEIGRFRAALDESREQLLAIRNRLCRFAVGEQRQILDAHILILQDELVVDQTIGLITTRAINAEWALEKIIGQIAATFANIHEPYLQARRDDVEQVGRRILHNLSGTENTPHPPPPYPATILFALDLSPAEVIAFPRRHVKGLVTARGGTTSHTAIIARSLELPAMLGADSAFATINEGDAVILDAETGQLLIGPTDEEIAVYRKQQLQTAKIQRAYSKERTLPAETTDGTRLMLAANLELLEEIPSAIEHGAERIGMYRTEYLFMNRQDLPSEEEQCAHYTQALQQMAPNSVTIRTFDVGGDNLVGFTTYRACANPALGLRAIRFCLRERALFKTQLRALYRASIHGPLRILFPMISALDELHQVRALTSEVHAELTAEKIPFDATVPQGIMIEVPSAVMLADQLAREVSFFCLGTNDLTQYTLAVDRGNDEVAYLAHSLHPAVLRMIHHTITAAKRHRIEVAVCGEMAGDPLCILALLGLDLNVLSMNSVSIPPVKRLIRKASVKNARQLAAALLRAATVTEVETLVGQAMELLGN